jgi:hypothetical protein
MKFNNNLAAIHAYLCGDGYVIKNPETQKHKYYHIGFRNTNKILLEDFQDKFQLIFGLKPYIVNNNRCRIQNKEIYSILTKDFSYYSYRWELPELSRNKLKFWLRAFFDCEGWVENYKYSRMVRLDCCNQIGTQKISEELEKFEIYNTIKKRKGRNIWRISICSKKSLKNFQKHINFLHPEKKEKLKNAINSFLK